MEPYYGCIGFSQKSSNHGGGSRVERLHLLHNVTEQTIDRFSVTDEKAHDSTEFSTGLWLEDRLVLFDQAYFKYRRFALIDENDGYFVSRLKPNANPETTRE